MRKAASESRFHMWRAVFALAHADHHVTDEEHKFMQDVLAQEKFSPAQAALLEEDIREASDIAELFMSIEEQEDRSLFFYFARMLCWSDGDFGKQEQEIILRLRSVHVRNIDFDRLLKSIDMELEDDYRLMIAEDMKTRGNPIAKFVRRFGVK